MHGLNYPIKYFSVFTCFFFSFLLADLRFDPNLSQKDTQSSKFYVGPQKSLRPEYLSDQKRLMPSVRHTAKNGTINRGWQQLLALGDFDSLRAQAQKLEEIFGSKSWHVKKFFFPAWAHQQEHACAAIKRLLISDRARTLEKVKYGSMREAKKEIAKLESSWPYNQQIIHSVVQQQHIDSYFKQIGFNELQAARALFEQRADFQALGVPIDQQICTILERSKNSISVFQALALRAQKIIARAEQNNVFVSPQIKNRIAWATDITDSGELGDIVFKIATAEHLLGDIADMAGDGHVTMQKRDSSLLARGLSKYFEYLFGPTEIEVSLICDIARYISDVTIGSCYLSREVRQQRIAQFWHKWDSLSLENLSNITAGQIVDSVAYIAARATYAMGAHATISVVKNIKNVGAAAARVAALFAERFMQVLDSVIAAHPAVVTNEGAVIWNASEQAATKARQAMLAFNGMKDKDSGRSPAEALDSTKKVVENEKVVEIDNVLKEAEKRFAKSKDLTKVLDEIIENLSDKVNNEPVGELLEKTHSSKIPSIIEDAEKFYRSMRKTNNDIEAISKNTKIPKDIIKKIKDHVFVDKHIAYGKTNFFEPDADMAAAWKRLMNNDFVRSDLIFLQHEYTESIIMNGHEISWEQAHPIVNRVYNWEISLKG